MELTPVGYFSKPHGIKGNLILKEEHAFLFEDAKVFFVDMQTGRAPYFISTLNKANNGLIIGLEDVDSIDKARLLVGKQVFVDAALVVKEDNFTWIGYELIDKQYGSLGVIKEVTDNGQQQLLGVMFRNREVMLPLVDDFIEKVEHEGKKLFYEAPEGLIDVYLNETE